MTTLAETLRDLDRDLAAILGSDPHAPGLIAYRAQMREATAAEQRAARRKWERAMLGCCPCGEVTGEAECPWCDLGLPKKAADLAREEQRRAEWRAAVAKMMADLRPGPVVQPAGATRAPNRRERRAAKSRKR